MMTILKGGLAIFAVAAAALALGLWAGLRHWEAGPAAAMSAEQLFEAEFPDLAGKPQRLSHWRGQVLLINFWATWCPPCRAEMPEFVRLQARFRERGFTLVGIALDEAEEVRAFARELGVNYPLLLGGAAGSALARELGSRGALPFSVLVDREGRVVMRRLGTLSEAEAVQLITPLL